MSEQQPPRRRHSARRKTGARSAAQPVPAATPALASAADPARAAHGLGVFPVHVRWHDLDAFNHVNNASYLVFLEETRLQWLRTVPGDWFNEHAMPVMAAVELHYRKPITWPAEIDVHKACEHVGNSSVTVANRIVDRGDPNLVYAEGKIVLVWIDPTTGSAVALPDAIRSALG